jgi:hypothetical protein
MTSRVATITTRFSVIVFATASIFLDLDSTDNCDAQFVSLPDTVYGHKITCVNSSVFDFWNFKTISTDGLANFVINFYPSTNEAFHFFENPNDIVTTVGIHAISPNVTTASFQISATQATVDSISG